VAKRYALVLGFAALALWLGFRDEVLGPALLLWRIDVARAVVTLIHWVGMDAAREGSVVFHPAGFAYQISKGCTGFVPAALLATAVGAYPAASRRKLAGLLLGVPLILGVNLARLVHLYYLGVYQPRWFPLAHGIVWEGIIALAVLGSWLGWTMWADRGSG
jgi:exosortase/archaeosortase family protein